MNLEASNRNADKQQVPTHISLHILWDDLHEGEVIIHSFVLCSIQGHLNFKAQDSKWLFLPGLLFHLRHFSKDLTIVREGFLLWRQAGNLGRMIPSSKNPTWANWNLEASHGIITKLSKWMPKIPLLVLFLRTRLKTVGLFTGWLFFPLRWTY